VVLLAMLLAISSPAKAGGISRRLINTMVAECRDSSSSPNPHIKDLSRVPRLKSL